MACYNSGQQATVRSTRCVLRGGQYAMKLSPDHPPARQRRIDDVRSRLQTFLARRGYRRVATPMLEPTDLFLRKSGGELAARLYSFTDPRGSGVSLRPEFTSSVVRAFVDGSLRGPLPQRWMYAGPVFRYESEDGAGEFEQCGAEMLGAGTAAADAEVLALAAQGLSALGVSGHRLRIGHMGVVAAMLTALGLSERARVFVMRSLAPLGSGEESIEDIRGRAEGLGLLNPETARSPARITRGMSMEDASATVRGLIGRGAAGARGRRTPDEVLQRYLGKLRDAEAPETLDRGLALCQELAGIAGPPERVRPRLSRIARRHAIPRGRARAGG